MDLLTLQILNWKNFAKNVIKPNNLKAALKLLDNAISNRTYLVEDELSDADRAIFQSVHSNGDYISEIKNNPCFVNVLRYYDHLLSLDEMKPILNKIKPKEKTITKLDGKSQSKDEKSKSNVQFEEGGNFIGLQNAVKGNVVVRFPPEASGYLHIGHAKAALINQHYKDHYDGKLIMRFDDTNPAKESEEFEKIILEDVKSLGITFDKLTYSSDYFENLLVYCEQLIQSGNAYADNTDPETMKKQRENFQESECRSHSILENMELWNQMKQGSSTGLQTCVRLKLDPQSKNGCMRDPTIYRCKVEPHIRTGTKYHVYPTYDFACPVIDSIEGVTHTLRTSEYNDRNEQFYTILSLLALRAPAIADYSRLSLQNTVLSKRKLTQIVDERLVGGWDDPRMPTVRGVLRHGMTIAGLKEFVLAQGFGRANVVMEWDKLWAFNKKVIDPIAPRFTALSGSDKSLVLVRVDGQTTITHDTVVKHPKNEEVGRKSITFSPSVLVERDDAVEFQVGQNVTFINWGNLKIKEIHRHPLSGDIESIDASLNLEDRDFKKTQKISWLPLGTSGDWESFAIPISALFYDNIITKNVLDKDDRFMDFVNRESKREDSLIGDREMSELKKGDIIQIQRRGFFICDQPYRRKTNDVELESPLILVNIPEGNKKERPTTGVKAKSSTNNVCNGTEKKVTENKAKSSTNNACDGTEKKVSKNIRNENSIKEKLGNERSAKKKSEKEISVKERSNNGIDIKDNSGELPANILKKQTKLGLDTGKDENFSKWYTQVVIKSKLLEYSDISGCYIMKPGSCLIWKRIQAFIDAEIEVKGVLPSYYPMLISEAALVREKNHIADFSPEVAWVTMAGDKTLEQRLAIRPTSETAMYPEFAQEIQSYRDLPLKINQWCNVVRWEFKQPMPFLRSREFLWQEGHTAFATREEAVAEVYDILDMYAAVYENLLAVPVVKGHKTEKEKFAGADFTTTTEVYIAGTGRAVQGATSHHLGQNFSRMFNIRYKTDRADSEDDSEKKGDMEFVYQNSWGMTTRTIGIMVMVHGDKKGLVLPPRVASTQVVVVPVGFSGQTDEMITELEHQCVTLSNRLVRAGCRAIADIDKHRSPGWKFNHWELKGVPIRIEIGPRDLASKQVLMVIRLDGSKHVISDDGLERVIMDRLEEVQAAMLTKAREQLDAHRVTAYTMSELCSALDNKMLITAPFCGDKNCEEQIKIISAGQSVVEEGAPSMGAKSLCTPFLQPDGLGERCVRAECDKKPLHFTMFGRSY